MTDVPQRAITAVARALQRHHDPEAWNQGDDPTRREMAEAAAALEAAEAAWPHDPPKRDPASTTAATTSVATPPAASARRREFGGPRAFGFTSQETA